MTAIFAALFLAGSLVLDVIGRRGDAWFFLAVAGACALLAIADEIARVRQGRWHR